MMRVHPGGDGREAGSDTGGNVGVRGGKGEEDLAIISIEMIREAMGGDEGTQGADIIYSYGQKLCITLWN
ncbi:UNVERIFIED_CONTAM: hypothetical protein FKN15_023531 [Acipenser sinensis]